MWRGNPLDNLLELESDSSPHSNDPNTRWSRMYRSTFWQKVADSFRVLGGYMYITLTSYRGNSLYIEREYVDEYGQERLLRMGLLDYVPFLFLFKLMIAGLYRFLLVIFDKKERETNSFVSAAYHVLLAITALSMLLISAIQFSIVALFTIISLPVIGIVHVYSQYKKQEILAKAEKEFAPNYEAQNRSVVAKDAIVSELVNYNAGPTKNILATLKSAAQILDNAEEVNTYRTCKVVLFSLRNPQAGQQVGEPFRLNYFYKFNYNPAGLAAYRNLCVLNDSICSISNVDHAVTKSSISNVDHDVTKMILTYITLMQVSRDPASVSLVSDVVIEISIHTVDEPSLTLTDKRSILFGLQRYYSAEATRASVDDTAYDNAAYVRYTK